MLESFKYVNHVGEVLEFGKDGLFANSNDLRDYSWNYDSDKNRIENFRKGVVNKTIPVVIVAQSEEEGLLKKNQLFEVFEKDVIAEQTGKIIIDDYYLQCYVYASKKSEYLMDKKVLITTISIVGIGKWFKETTHEFIYSESEDTTGRGYPYDYEHDYSVDNGNIGILFNSHFGSCDFIIKISGYAFEPSITIADHIYKVNETIQEGDVLIIDSRKKTITLSRHGVIVNCFAKRDKRSYIFEKIPSGNLAVYWNSGFNFEITLLEERGEPKWI